MIQVIKGNFIFTKEKESFEVCENSFMVVDNGVIVSLSKNLSEQYDRVTIEDFGDRLIIPGFVDLHLHASQWPNRGVGYDEELLPWLNKYTFPLEATFKNLEIADQHYSSFIQNLINVGTTRACIFATRHLEATRLLISKLKDSGIGAFVGKVNMDRNADESLVENTKDSINETLDLINEDLSNPDPLVHYMLTPRFVPSVTPELMTELGKMAEKYDLPIQSHLDENLDEIAWVNRLHPTIPSFAQVYEHFHLLRSYKTIMAHCIHMTDEEIRLLKDRHIYIAHCVASNSNLSSGIMPLRKYLDNDMLIGLGSDIAGGHTLDMRENMVLTIQASKLYYTTHHEYKPISLSEAFYLATKGGGSFFGKVGSFEKGYEFDALVIEDNPSDESVIRRLERFIYTGTPENIVRRYVRGKRMEKQ